MFGRIFFDPGASGAAGGGGSASTAGGTGAGTGSGGGGAPVSSGDWKASLPAELKDAPSLKDIKDIGDLAKGYVHAQRAIGNNVAVPTKDSKPEEWAAFFNKVGRPEAPEKYDFGKIDGEDKVPIPAELKQGFMKSAHEFGLSNRQAAQLYSWFVSTTGKGLSEQQAAVQQSQAAGINALKSEWGTAFDQNLDMAKMALKEFGGDDAVKLMNETGLGDDPRVIRLFEKVGRAMSEDKLHSQGKQGNFKLTPAEAEATIAQKQTDHEFMKLYMAGDKNAVAVMKELFEAKNAGR